MNRKNLSLLAALLVLVAPNVQAQLDDNERAMIAWVDEHGLDSIDLLEETVNIGSGTMNHAGVRAVGDVMRRELDELGLETEWIEMPP